MLYQQRPSSWYMEQSREHQVGQGQHMPQCIQRSGWHSELNRDPGLQLTSMATKHCKTWHRCLHVHKSPPKVKAVTDYKAALAVQRPFFKPVSEMSYSYTPQMHFCILLSKKKSSTFACKGGQRPISQCLDKQNISGFHLTQAIELPAHALEI